MAPPAATPGRRRESDAAGVDTTAGLASEFGALMLAIHDTTAQRLQGRDADASANQMFEPDVEDARARRAQTLRQDDRRAAVTHQQELSEQRAKHALDRSKPDTMGRQTLRPSTELVDPGKTATGDEGARKGPSRVDPGFLDKAGKGGKSSIDSSSRARADAAVSPSRTGRFTAPHSAQAGPDGLGTAATVGSTRAVAGTAGATSNQSTAGHVAKVLSVGGSGDGTSGRAAPQSASVGQHEEAAAKPSETGRSRPSGAPAKGGGGAEAPVGPNKSAFDGLVQSIRMQAGSRTSTARIQLNPPNLGAMLVHVRMSGNELEIKVLTQSAEARDLLLERGGQLREALVQAGIHVERFEVSSDLSGDGSADAAWSEGFDMPPPAERRPDHDATGLAERRQDAVGDTTSDDGIQEQEFVSPAMARLDVTI